MRDRCFPAPGGWRGRKQANRATLAPSRGGLEREQQQGKLWSLPPSLSRKQREGNESSILSHWHPSLKCADKGCSQVQDLLWKPEEKREMGWERHEADSRAPEARKEGTLDVGEGWLTYRSQRRGGVTQGSRMTLRTEKWHWV